MSDGLDHIPCTGLTLRSDEGSTLGDTTEGLPQVPGSTNEWHFERVLVDVVLFIGWGQDLRLIDIIDADLLEDL